jgi:hypothetical protein
MKVGQGEWVSSDDEVAGGRNNDGRGGGILPSLTDALRFELHAMALVA